MDKRLRWILICSALLGFFIQLQRPNPTRDTSGADLTAWIMDRHDHLRASYQEPEHADYLISTTLGEKRWLNIETKRLHQKFNLTHLFTPSGLHFGALALALRPLLRTPLLRALFYLAPLCLSGFYSCKRVGLLLASKSLFRGISLYALFLLVMAIDFAFGTYQSSPQSFLYSFTFLGIFLVSSEHSKVALFFNLLIAQLTISLFSGESIAPWGVFIGLIFTPIFCLFFALLFLGLFIPALSPLISPLLSAWFNLLRMTPAPEFYISASLPLVFVLVFRNRIPMLLSATLLLFHCESIGPTKGHARFLNEKPLPEHAVSEIVRKRYGYQVDSNKWGLRCRYELVKESWRASCRDLPAWKKRQKLVANESS